MILQRLYELALREGLLDDMAFEEQPVPFIINIDDDGRYLGIEVRRGEMVLPSRKKGGEPKKVPDKGKLLSVPRPHGSVANPGFARFFADTLPRILPISEEEKSKRSRETFWKQVRLATDQTADPGLRAVMTLGRQLVEDGALAARVRAEVEELKPGASDRCTFAIHSHRGKTLVEWQPVRDWYRRFFETVQGQKQGQGPTGLCQITGKVGPIPTTHPIKLSGIPGGLPTGVSMVSYDKAAFESYGLDGTANAAIGYEAADGYARALTALIGNKLQGNPRTSLRVGSTLFLFWTREPEDTNDVMALDNPAPELVERLMKSAHAGKEFHALPNANAFYLLGLSGNSARAIIRDYLEAPLPQVRTNLAQWFRDLTIAAATKDGAGQPTNLFPLWQLVAATALDMDQVAPQVPARLVHAALKGELVPESLLAACVGRLRAEGRDGFRPPRMALIKLTLHRRNVPVTETLDLNERNPAYVCGRLMSVFEQIQYAALGDVNATVTDKFFGTFSAAPAVVIGRLYANAQNHLRKLRGDNPGSYVALDKLLTEVSSLLKREEEGQTELTLPQHQLSLIEQGLFGLGYYHQKAKRFEEIAQRKLAKAAAATKSE
jgi:CRISPR-associated protein Csd1